MKKIIAGKKYDTKTATSLADNRNAQNEWPGGRGWELFRTNGGAFFLAHWSCWDGEKDVIEPLTEAEAKTHCEECAVDGDTIEEIFGEAEEAGADDMVMLPITRDLRDQLKVRAAQEKITMRSIVENLIRGWLNPRKK